MRSFLVIGDSKFELEDAYSLQNCPPNSRIRFRDKDYTIIRIVPVAEEVEGSNQLFITFEYFLE